MDSYDTVIIGFYNLAGTCSEDYRDIQKGGKVI